MPNDPDIRQRSGRRLHLCELRQYGTYGGLMEGLPTADLNREILGRLIDRHRDEPYPGPPHLIPPVEEPIADPGGIRHPRGTPSALPAVTCIGNYTSSPRARMSCSDLSGLVVIWFQREFAFPIDPDVLVRLQELDWDRHAIDLDY